MSEQVTIAQARHGLASLVRRLERLQRIEITRRGKPVAVMLSWDAYQRLSREPVGFWQAYTDFRQETDLASLQIESEIFTGLRSQDPGREVDL